MRMLWVLLIPAVYLLLSFHARKRRARKRLVAAALSVINNHRRHANKPYPLSQFEERCETALVMVELIDATQYVN